MHGCVHAWTIHVLNTERSQALAWTAIRCVASRIPNREQDKYWIVQRRLLQHADRCVKIFDIGIDLEDNAWIFYNLGILYSDQGRLKEAEAMYDRALQGYEKALGSDHTSTLDTVDNLGILYSDQGRLKEAEAMYDRALQGYEKALGSDHTSTLDTVDNLGLLYKDQGRLKEAEAMYERALQGYEKALGSHAMKTYVPALNTLENLGSLSKQLGDAEAAVTYYQRAQSGLLSVFGSHNERYRNVSGKIYSLQSSSQETDVSLS